MEPVNPHTSVLLRECLELFAPNPIKIFVDGTLGAGGHAEAILTQHPEIERFIGIDQDPVALNLAKERLKKWAHKVSFVQGNFAGLKTYLEQMDIAAIDGFLIDLGVSSMQFDQPERGFSFRFDAPLDMRMDPNNPVSAATIVNTWDEREIARIFRDYGEIKPWRKAAATIIEARKRAPIQTTAQLVAVLDPVMAYYKKPGLHPMTLIFQALRIAVNRELDVLEQVLPLVIDRLRPTGRMGVISFHSLEDRIVKNCFRFEASDKYNTSGIGGLFLDKDPRVELLTTKPISAKDDEIQMNPRSRSAKLRGVEKR
jgi:16S rRNA (cytosine1402-N4)-methyltransferase